MQSLTHITDIAHVIQLSVAPVFLLTGIGAIFRALEHLLPQVSGDALRSAQSEMTVLAQRARAVHWAIGLCTSSALLVCVVIATLFVGSIAGIQMPVVIANLFVLAMLSLVAGLLCFLREIALAKGSIHVLPR